jgi:predicted nuclease of predicted toxin-antitoxin system
MPSFLIDEDLPQSLSSFLRRSGYESKHVAELGMRGLSDNAIYRAAQERDAVLTSRDLGFANTLEYAPGTHRGLVVVRYPSKTPMDLLMVKIGTSLAKLRRGNLTEHSSLSSRIALECAAPAPEN